MNPRTKLDQVIDILRSQNYTEQKITEFVQQLNDMGYQKFYSESMAVFTREDFEEIKNCKDQLGANLKIRELFTLRKGKDPSIAMREYVDMFAEGFLAGNIYTETIKGK